MNNGLLLLLSILIPFLFSGSFFWFYHRKKQHTKPTLSIDLKHFKKAHEINDIKGIINYGNKIFYNLNLDNTALLVLDRIISERIKKHPELEELRLLIYNKKLDWHRPKNRYFY